MDWDLVHAKVRRAATVILAAIGYTSGTKQVNLGIYSYDASSGSVGDPLIGAQGDITQMPDVGDCCQLARVTLPGDGVALTAGTKYWVVASPDNVNAPTFEGGWHVSHQDQYAYLSPPPSLDRAGVAMAGGANSRHDRSLG